MIHDQIFNKNNIQCIPALQNLEANINQSTRQWLKLTKHDESKPEIEKPNNTDNHIASGTVFFTHQLIQNSSN